MKWPPTDLKILEEIYRRYYTAFVNYSEKSKNRSTKQYVPIDMMQLAEHFGIDVDIIFGRLYYHLDPQFRFKQQDGSKVQFFVLKLGKDVSVVHFTLLASVIAKLRDERKKYITTTCISIAAFIISVIAVVITMT